MKKLRAYFNIGRLRLNMGLRRETIHNYPIWAFIEPTTVCHLHCPACPTGLRLGMRPHATIDWELFRSVIDELGDYIFSLYMYNWGEPLLSKQTPEMVRYAKEREIWVSLSSNLSMPLTDAYIERLVQSGPDELVVALDGVCPETYTRYRRNGDFSLVVANMKRIQDAKRRLGSNLPLVRWQFLVFRHNEHEIDRAMQVYKDWGADSISFQGPQMPFEPHNDGIEPSTIPQYNIRHPSHPYHDTIKKHLNSGRPCSWPFAIFVLNPNGSVSPCCASPEERHDWGKFDPARGFFAVWNTPAFRRGRSLVARMSERRDVSGAQVQELANWIDGMGVKAASSLKESSLICERCPALFIQDLAVDAIQAEAEKLRQAFMGADSWSDMAKAFTAYLLMGAPGGSDWKNSILLKAKERLDRRRLARRRVMRQPTTRIRSDAGPGKVTTKES